LTLLSTLHSTTIRYITTSIRRATTPRTHGETSFLPFQKRAKAKRRLCMGNLSLRRSCDHHHFGRLSVAFRQKFSLSSPSTSPHQLSPITTISTEGRTCMHDCGELPSGFLRLSCLSFTHPHHPHTKRDQECMNCGWSEEGDAIRYCFVFVTTEALQHGAAERRRADSFCSVSFIDCVCGISARRTASRGVAADLRLSFTSLRGTEMKPSG